jgi:hypothetical protein
MFLLHYIHRNPQGTYYNLLGCFHFQIVSMDGNWIFLLLHLFFNIRILSFCVFTLIFFMTVLVSSKLCLPCSAFTSSISTTPSFSIYGVSLVPHSHRQYPQHLRFLFIVSPKACKLFGKSIYTSMFLNLLS